MALSKNLIKDMNWAVNEPPNLRFSLHMHDLISEGFELNNQDGVFEGESFEPIRGKKVPANWVVLTNSEAGITVKITANSCFGTTLELINDKFGIIVKKGN